MIKNHMLWWTMYGRAFQELEEDGFELPHPSRFCLAARAYDKDNMKVPIYGMAYETYSSDGGMSFDDGPQIKTRAMVGWNLGSDELVFQKFVNNRPQQITKHELIEDLRGRSIYRRDSIIDPQLRRTFTRDLYKWGLA